MTQEQFDILAPFESYFDTAINKRYASYCGTRGVITITRVYNDITGEHRNASTSCGACILRLLRDCGRLYFEHKATLTEQPKKTRPKRTTKRKDA